MRFSMKLMGVAKLLELIQDCDGPRAGAVAALSAELKSADWSDRSDAANDYPSAIIHGRRLQIAIDDRHCVVVVVNYEAGVILIEFAGPVEKLAKAGRLKGRKGA
jgi:hypothetical protein